MRGRVAWAAAASAAAWIAGWGQAQQDRPSRTVEALRAEVDALQRELFEARGRIAALEAERTELMERLRRAEAVIAEMRAGAASPPESLAPVPADPLAAPDAMLAELVRRYDQDLGTMPRNDPLRGAEQDAALRSAAARWCERMAREVRGRTEWFVTIEEVRDETDAAGERHVSALVRVIDPATRLSIGPRQRRPFAPRFIDRVVREAERQAPTVPVWRAAVSVSAQPRYAGDRVEPGPYNTPPFVGRYVEFGMSLEWVTLLVASEEDLARAATGERRPVR